MHGRPLAWALGLVASVGAGCAGCLEDLARTGTGGALCEPTGSPVPARHLQVDGGTGVQCARLNELSRGCEELFVQGGAVDIVWVVDNSGSMNREITEVGDKINSFAREVERSGLDYRVVFLTAGPGETNGVCVPEPLAGPRCQDTPRFRHVRQPVDSTNGLQLLLDRYGSFDLFLRPEATRHVVMVTDDDSNLPAPAYRAEAAARAPLLEHAIVHGVVGLSFRDCPDIARVGTVYQELAQATGGVVVPICCPDYDKLVLVLARDVVASLLRFTLAHPANPFSVAVALQDAQGGRAAVTDGWHYDVDTQSVLFAESFRPPTGAIVVVTYTTN